MTSLHPPVHSPSLSVSGYIPVTTPQKFPSGRSGPSFGPLVENKQKTSVLNTPQLFGFFKLPVQFTRMVVLKPLQQVVDVDDVKI